jgi:hypothetical protein
LPVLGLTCHWPRHAALAFTRLPTEVDYLASGPKKHRDLGLCLTSRLIALTGPGNSLRPGIEGTDPRQGSSGPGVSLIATKPDPEGMHRRPVPGTGRPPHWCEIFDGDQVVGRTERIGLSPQQYWRAHPADSSPPGTSPGAVTRRRRWSGCGMLAANGAGTRKGTCSPDVSNNGAQEMSRGADLGSARAVSISAQLFGSMSTL